MGKTIGQGQDDAAFEELMGFYAHLQTILHYAVFREAMRVAFDAGMKRGLEKCGCCEAVRRG